MTTILQYPDTPCSYPSALGANVTAAIGNTPPSGSLTDVNAESLGLVLPIGGQFAIVCSTQTAASTTGLAWTVNWLERD